jgi:hypothetical protein
MSVCVKCNKSIKPASLATEVAGEKFHPTCISCAICDRPLWGRDFVRTKSGKLTCAVPCEPAAPPKRPQSAARIRPPSAQQVAFQQQQQQQQQELFGNEKMNAINQPTQQDNNLEMFKRTNTAAPQNAERFCQVCNESVRNRRFITYENGDVICQECDNRLKNKPPRVNSAHMITCSICNKTLRGSKFFTEPNGELVCENCDAKGARCAGCQKLLKSNEPLRTLANGRQFHEGCLACGVCNKQIQTKDFYQSENMTPMCLDCYEVSKLPKCSACSRHISGAYFLIDNKPIHAECFKCAECQSPLNNKDGFFRNKSTGAPICSNCNIKLNGSKCFRCSQVIEKDGVTFNERDYHQTCYTCDVCGNELMRYKKTLTDKAGLGLYCEPCHIQKFAPKCNKCGQPIPPYMPGTQYEDKMYHKECFACSRCKKSLENKKFFKTGNLTVCEQCY